MLVKQVNQKICDLLEVALLHIQLWIGQLLIRWLVTQQNTNNPFYQDEKIMQKCLENDMIKGRINIWKESIWASAQVGNEEWSSCVHIQATKMPMYKFKVYSQTKCEINLSFIYH